MAEEKKDDDVLGDGLLDIFEEEDDEESDLSGLTGDLEAVAMSDVYSLAMRVVTELRQMRAEADL